MIAYLYKSNHTIKLLKRFSFVKTDPKCGPTLLLKISILTNLSIIWGCFHQSDSLFRQFIFEGDFYRFFSIYSYVNSCPLIPIVARPFPRGSWFEQTWICFSFSGWLDLENNTFKDYSKYSNVKFHLPLWPHITRGGQGLNKLVFIHESFSFSSW